MSAALASGALVLLGAVAVGHILRVGDHRAALGRPARAVPLVRPPGWLAAALADVALPVRAELVVTAWVVALSVAGAGGLAAGGPALACVLVVVTVVAPALALAGGRGRADHRVEAALPELLDAVARSLRSGATLPGALAEAAGAGGPAAAGVAQVVDEVDGGVPLGDALEAWPGRLPLAGVRLAAAALSLSADAGGAAARAVDGVAATLRANLAVAGEVRAQASQARLSGLVIALAPLAFGALAAGTDPRTAEFLLRTPFGVACLALGLTLDAVAAWWMHRITGAGR